VCQSDAVLRLAKQGVSVLAQPIFTEQLRCAGRILANDVQAIVRGDTYLLPLYAVLFEQLATALSRAISVARPLHFSF
jgi:hypothetical protein